MEKTARLEKLKGIVEQCRQCPLGHTRDKSVFGQGSSDALVMFIGEGPGRTENQQGQPFVGRSGQLLRKMIEAIGLTDHVYIVNICKCWPPDNRTPEQNEIDTCVRYLKKQIEIISPRYLVLLGKTAVRGLFPELGEESINNLRFKRDKLPPSYEGIPVIITYHPSALLQNPSYKPAVKADFELIQRLCAGLSDQKFDEVL